MGATVFYLLCYKDTSIQSKRFGNKKYLLRLGNVSGDFSGNNIKKQD